MNQQEYDKVLKEVLADFDFDAQADVERNISPAMAQAPEKFQDIGEGLRYDDNGNIVGRNERETVMTKMHVFEVGIDVLNQRLKRVETELANQIRKVNALTSKEQGQTGMFN